MNPCNPTDPVPVPRDVVEAARECARALEIKTDFASFHEAGTPQDTADFRALNSSLHAKAKECIAALESALAAPPDDGWNRNLDEAPTDDYVLLSVTGTSKCAFFEPQSVCSWWDEVEEQWMSFPKGYHQRHQIIAWRTLPAPAKPKPEVSNG